MLRRLHWKQEVLMENQTEIIYSYISVKVVEEIHVYGHVFRRFVQTPLPTSQLEFVIKI